MTVCIYCMPSKSRFRGVLISWPGHHLWPFSSKPFIYSETSCIKDGAYFCYFAYVLHISRYLGFQWVVPTNTGIFLRSLFLGITMHFSEIIKLQFVKKKTPHIALYFTTFYNNCCLFISKKCSSTPNFLSGVQ